jgi:plastocyanin
VRAGALARVVLIGLAALAAPAAAASAATAPVHIEFQAFAPDALQVLPGDIVEWANVSERQHTVTANDGAFDSGTLNANDRFSRTFDAVGLVAYHCSIHPVMTGTVDVRRVILYPLPPAAVPQGTRVDLSGRTADLGGPLTIERDDGSGFRAVETAPVAPDGTWRASVRAAATADYRAVSGADASTVRRLLVTDRHVQVRVARHRLHVTVTPPAPGAEVMLQLHLRERFGWWPTARARLDYLSRADFRLTRHARARVVLVDRDRWTPIAISRVVRVR